MPFQPQTPPGSRPPLRLAAPESPSSAPSRRLDQARRRIPAQPALLFATQLDDLLAEIERLGGGATPQDRSRLASGARDLARRQGLPAARLENLLEALAVALTDGQGEEIQNALRRLREAARGGGDRPRSNRFWR